MSIGVKRHAENYRDFAKLDYDVVEHSSYSASYTPHQIKIDRPLDQACRWSSAVNDQNQYLLLKLPAITLIKSVTFGKFHKVHVCNLKEFKIEMGLTKDEMRLVLHSGLRNDHEQETFPVEDGLAQWVRIVPLVPWGGNFNFSIWYVELRGYGPEHALTKECLKESLGAKRSREWQLCARLLRESKLGRIATEIDGLFGGTLANPVLNMLYELIVTKGNFEVAEKELMSCSQRMVDGYIEREVPYKARWTRLDQCLLDSNGSTFGLLAPRPCARGGHQMVFDPVTHKIFLFGGWEGHKDLSDLWSYDTASHRWACLSQACERDGGPSPRSCHKIAVDAGRRILLVLGRYVDPDSRPENAADLKCELYCYNIDDQTWSVLCADCAAVGGPTLIYDHQMVIDEEHAVMYVFGGRSIANKSENSGLYSFSLSSMAWKLIRSDECFPRATPHFRSRIGHSMVWDAPSRSLVIFSGN